VARPSPDPTGTPSKGAIVPHAPVLVVETSDSGVIEARGRITKSMRAMEWRNLDAIVIVSPHGTRQGIYRLPSGTLERFGMSGISVTGRTHHDVAARLAELWGGFVEGPADHGVVVPMLLGSWDGIPVVGAAFPEVTGPFGKAVRLVLDAGRSLADAMRVVARDHEIAFVASAHTAASLSPRGPILQRPAGEQLDRLIRHALGDDAGALARIEPALWGESGSCGVGPFVAMGELFAGRTASVASYEAPAGVGYLVAETSEG
jgi:hypothetical protein